MEYEQRFATGTVKVEQRADDENSGGKLVGYASVFDSLSENLGGFRELVDAKAFDEVLQDDVRAVFNHSPDFVLGRTKSGTLKLSVDKVGLRYEIDLPNTQAARDVMESIARGDVDGSSFKFRVAPNGDEWREDDDGRTVRTITKVERLLDVGPVTFPAYPDASVAKRSLDDFQAKKQGCKKVDTMIAQLEMKKHL